MSPMTMCGDVGVEPLGDVAGQAGQTNGPDVMLDDAALFHAGRFADDVDGDVDLDLDVSGDLQEVDVEDRAADRVALQLTREGEVGIALDLEVDEDVAAGVGLERAHQRHAIDRDRDRVQPPPVQDRGHLPDGPQLPGNAFSGPLTSFRLDGYFHGRSTSGR